jgi:membrane associated rhomboid family serine protease
MFNLAWLWYFGTTVEAAFSKDALPLLCLYAAAGSAAEYAFMSHGIGLSGVVYGLFGMSWVLSRADDRFSALVDGMVRNLFIGWFVLCVVLTWLGLWRVGNFAHAGGAIVGILVGAAYVRKGLLFPILTAAGVIAILLAAIVVPILSA